MISIAEEGLKENIIITEDNCIVDGVQRLAAL
jgi:hypothetical protein